MTKRAVITGAGRGLGLEFAKQCLARGYAVTGAVRSPEKAHELRALGAEAGGEVEVVALDVGDAESVTRCAAEIAERHAAVDLLINNAGINSMSRGIPDEQRNLKLGSLEPEGIVTMIRVNAIGPVLFTQALLPQLEAAGGARVVHISSWLGSNTVKSSGGNYGYCGSKATLNMLGRALGLDLVDRGVVSAMFNPGWVQTDMGGQKAKLTPEQSVGGILETVHGLTVEDNGRFLQWDGSEHPW